MDSVFEDEDVGNDNFCDESEPMEAEAEEPMPFPSPALVGAPGQEFVSTMLSTKEPATAIGEVQTKASLPGRCTPLLELLDQLGVRRYESHRYVLHKARGLLLQRVANMPPEKLLQLLEATFAFIGIPDLRSIPLAVLSRLEPVPATFLKQLSNDRELFNDLPNGVQRQVWELDKKLLQQHALPKVMAYIQDTGITHQALDMGECLRAQYRDQDMDSVRETDQVIEADAASAHGASMSRAKLRAQCEPLQDLVKMVGQSRLVYRGIVELSLVKFRDSDSPQVSHQDAGLCTLRSQLLMALHDRKDVELCRTEHCHKLAWIIDACLRDHVMDERRLRELNGFFQLYDNIANKDSKRKSKLTRHADRGDAESAGGLSHAPNDEPGRLLGEAGVVLRDPSTMHLLFSFVIRQLEEGVRNFKMPADNKDLVFVTRLLQLALSARGQLQERRYCFPEASNLILRSFYPLLSTFMADSHISKLRSETPALPPNASDLLNEDLVELLRGDEEVVRGITMACALDRLMAGDTYIAVSVIACLGAVAADSGRKGLTNWAAFGFSLALQLRFMYTKGTLKANTVLWAAAVDGLLIRVLDTEPQIHEQFLQLLLIAAPDLSDEDLLPYLKRVVKETRKARRRLRKAKVKGEGDHITPMGSQQLPGGLALQGKEELCQATYQLIASKLQDRVTTENCPDLFNLLSASGTRA